MRILMVTRTKSLLSLLPPTMQGLQNPDHGFESRRRLSKKRTLWETKSQSVFLYIHENNIFAECEVVTSYQAYSTAFRNDLARIMCPVKLRWTRSPDKSSAFIFTKNSSKAVCVST